MEEAAGILMRLGGRFGRHKKWLVPDDRVLVVVEVEKMSSVG